MVTWLSRRGSLWEICEVLQCRSNVVCVWLRVYLKGGRSRVLSVYMVSLH